MAINNNHTVQPINKDETDPSKIITTLNHNFQVLTERIKELNISLSYLDILKIATIFNATASDQAGNLQRFVSSCWNTLANYAGVYIQCVADKSNPVFVWRGQDIKHGGFIVKLPNNQSLYLPGADPTYLVPDSYNAETSEITYVPATSATEKTITFNFASAASTTLISGFTNVTAGAEIPSTYKDCRFYMGNEEVFFSNYCPGTTFSIPAGVGNIMAQYITSYAATNAGSENN